MAETSLRIAICSCLILCYSSSAMAAAPEDIASSKVAVHVTGSKLEATEGQNVTLLFETGQESVIEVKIIFEGEGKRKRLAKYCSPDADPICRPIYDQLLHVEEGNVSFILGNVNSSQSGLYIAQVINADKVVFEKTATLEVNKAPVSSSPAPPHSSSSPNPPSSSSSPNPPSSSDSYSLHWIVIVIVVISLVIIISGGVCFWILRKKRKRAADDEEEDDEEEDEDEEAPVVSGYEDLHFCFSKTKWKNNCSDCVSVTMNDCGGNAESLLKDS